MIIGAVAAATAAIAIVAAAFTETGLDPRRVRPVRISIALLVERWRARRARSRSAARAIEVLRGTQAGLRSGMPLSLALRSALATVPDEGHALFGAALRSIELNAGVEDAIREAPAGASGRAAALALDALALVGGEHLAATRAAAVLGSVCDRIAFEERLADEVRARTSGVRTQIVILAAIVPLIGSYLAFTVPGLATSLRSDLGSHILIPLASLFELTGIVASRAIVRSVRG